MPRTAELSDRSEAVAATIGATRAAPQHSRQASSPNFANSALRERAIAALRDAPDLLERAGLHVADQARTVLEPAPASWCRTATTSSRSVEFVEPRTALALESREPEHARVRALRATPNSRRSTSPTRLSPRSIGVIDLYEQGALVASSGGSLYISALLLARPRRRAPSPMARLTSAIELLAPPWTNAGARRWLRLRDRDPRRAARARERAAVILGAVLGGVLQNPARLSRCLPTAPRRTYGRSGMPSVSTGSTCALPRARA